MSHYRGVRARGSFLELCKDPAACAEVALFARAELAVDAAIVFSDILVVLEALGMGLRYDPGEGPRLADPIASEADLARLREPAAAAADLAYVHEAVRLTVRGLAADLPCLGFCGGPFTLASYAIEGGASRQFTRTKALMYTQPRAWERLMRALVEATAAHCRAQVEAGASCLQVFESWLGTLTAEDAQAQVAPWLSALIASLPAGIPVILYASGSAHLARALAATGVDVLSIDSAGDLAAAFALRGPGGAPLAVQGNLDPAALLAPRADLLARADRVLAAAGGRAGHIFNLGHGVLKETDPDQAKALVAHVRTARAHGDA